MCTLILACHCLETDCTPIGTAQVTLLIDLITCILASVEELGMLAIDFAFQWLALCLPLSTKSLPSATAAPVKDAIAETGADSLS